ncbi:MAG: hypothetical protein ACR2O1_12450 [Boseongicola sp.]
MTLLAPLVVNAQSVTDELACPAPNYRTDERPNSSGPATEVLFGAIVADLLEINDVDQTIKIDLAVRAKWKDPRLARWAGCKLSIRDIWFPSMMMLNSGRMFSRWPETVSVEKGGEITYLQRVSGTFSSYHSLTDFPFDKQAITLRMYPLEWRSSKVAYRIDETFSGMAPILNISDWEITGTSTKTVETHFEIFDQVRSGYWLTISAERQVSHYIWKIMFPIALIIFMSWCVFWINPSQFGTQLGLSATSMLTMVAFIFATTNLLPRLGYFTMLDRYIAGATIFVFAALLQSLFTGYLASRERTALALRIDFVSRYVFPLAFIVFCAKFYIDVF